VTLHVEGRSLAPDTPSPWAESADFEKVLTAELVGAVTRVGLVHSVCGWVCSEELLHEHSAAVAALIAEAVRDGAVCAAPPGTLLPLVGRDTRAQLALGVEHTLAHDAAPGSVALALGSLCVALGAAGTAAGAEAGAEAGAGAAVAQLRTAVPAVRIECTLGPLVFVLSAQLAPARASAYSECHLQLAGASEARHVASAAPPALRPREPGARAPLSHRCHRIECQEEHGSNVRRVARTAAAAHGFAARALLSRKVSLLSTATGDAGGATVHTIFFR